MISIGVTGMDELGRQLEALGRDVSTKILRDAGRAALEPVLEDMQQHAGYDDTASGPHARQHIYSFNYTRTVASDFTRRPKQVAPYEGAGAGIRHG